MKLDDDEINGYYQRKFLENSQPAKANIDGVTIFFAVLAAILLSWFIRDQYLEWQARRALEVFNQQMAIINVQTQNQFREIQIQAEKAKLENEERIRQEANRVQQIKLHKIEIEHQKQAAVEAQLAERVAKEAAWKETYRPIAGCEPEKSDRDLLKCGNDYARSHKRFKENWAKTH